MSEGAPSTDSARGAARLLPELYRRLRTLAEHSLAAFDDERTMQATAVVHEAYVKLAQSGDPKFADQSHFFAVAVHAIRCILVDRARRRLALKHGGGERPRSLSSPTTQQTAGFDPALAEVACNDEELLALDESLERLRCFDERKYEVVSLRYFSGLHVEDVADVLAISKATVKREWAFARAWLARDLTRDDTDGGRRG